MRLAALLLLLVLCRPLACLEVVRHSLRGPHVREFNPPSCVIWKDPLRPFTCNGIPLFFNASQPARVFDPNPVASLNDTTLMDDNDSAAAVPDEAYREVTVDLLGPHATIVDRQPPMTVQPDPNAPLRFDRGDDRFEPVNAYFHIDRMQRHLQSLGYAGSRQLVPYAIEVDPLARSGADTSFFLPSMTEAGRGTLYFGSGGTDDAEDADLVVHEYAHAILEWAAPGTFGGTFDSESRALSEGIGDYLAFSAHYDQRVASGRDPFCFADWDARCWTDAASEGCAYPPNSDCLRRLDSTRTMAGYQRGDVAGVEHRNGQIWSSALREIFLVLGRRITDTLVIESLFDAPPHPTFAVMARRLIEVDRLLYGGAHRDTICAAMTARGIAVSCDDTLRGELTVIQSIDRDLAIPDINTTGIVSRLVVTDPRAIERVAVRVDIDHSARGDLRVELVAPDGTRVLLQNISLDLADDIRVTYGIDAAPAQSLDVLRGQSAAGTWELRVADMRARDVGTLRSWGLLFQFAGDLPLTERPSAGTRQMIPVVARLFGANGSSFASDLRIANVTATTQTATLIFTRSGENGASSFSAIDVQLQPGQTVAFDDVLGSAFNTSGSGSLEIAGDVIAMSRTYAPDASGGTVGQQVAPVRFVTRAGQRPLLIAPLPDDRSRYNLGLTETRGETALVRIRRIGFESSSHLLLPFSHLQMPFEPAIAEISVIEGAGTIAAYISQVDNISGDAMFIPGDSGSGTRIAPVISAGPWHTDLWFGTARRDDTFLVYPFRYVGGGMIAPREPEVGSILVVPDAFDTPLAAVQFDPARKYPTGLRVRNGGMSQFISGEFTGDFAQHVFVESSDAFRTNIGVVLETPGPVFVEIFVYSAAGVLGESHELVVTGGIAQIPVRSRVTNGRAEVRIHGTSGLAYASIVDNVSGDATYVPWSVGLRPTSGADGR